MGDSIPNLAMPCVGTAGQATTTESFSSGEASEVSKKVKEKGLRKCPPEIREMIFKEYFKEYEYFGLEEPLLAVLKSWDPKMHQEATAIFANLATFHIGIEYEKEGDEFAYVDLIEKDIKPLVKKLIFEFVITRSNESSLFESDDTGETIPIERFFEGYTSVNEVVFRLGRFAELYKTPIDRQIQTVIEYIPIIEKVSVVFPVMPQSYENRLIGHARLLDREMEPFHAWHKTLPPSRLITFEHRDIDRFQAALKVPARLDSVRTCSNRVAHPPTQIRSETWYYMSYNFGFVDSYEVVWFWQAEEGDVLRWDEMAYEAAPRARLRRGELGQ